VDEDKDDEVQVAAALSKREAGVVPKDQQKSFQSMTSMIKGMCATDNDGSFCAMQPDIVMMLASQATPDAKSTQPTGGKKYAAMCSFCGRKIMGASMGMNPDRAERKKMADLMVQGCFKKDDMNKFCGEYVGECSLVFAKYTYVHSEHMVVILLFFDAFEFLLHATDSNKQYALTC